MEYLQSIAGNVTITDPIKNEVFKSEFYEMFLNYLLAETKETTIKGYIVGLKNFIAWNNDNNVLNPSEESIEAYKLYLTNKPSLTQGTKARYLRIVKQFFDYLAKRNLYKDVTINIKNFKTNNHKTTKRAFTENEIKKVLDSIDTSTEEGKRNKAIILLAVTGGLRTIELNRIDIADMETIDGQTIINIQGKGRNEKDEYIKVIPEVKTLITDYLKARRPKSNNEPLFTSVSNRAKGQRIPTPSISRLIKNIYIKAGFNSTSLTAHSLRHTSNTLLFKAGADLYEVQQHARHTDPKTTEIYLHTNERAERETEAKVFNTIYNIDKKTTEERLKERIAGLTEEEKLQLLETLKTA